MKVIILANDCVHNHLYYALLFLRYSSRAVVIEGACGDGASISRRNPASFTACAVAAPKQPILTSPCSNSGKFFSNDAIPEGLKYITTIYNAITQHKALHIEYKTFHDKNYSWDIHPYFLREYNNRWFLITLNNLDRQLLHIALDRIIEIQETDIDYIENNVIDDIQKYFEDVIGVTIPREGRPETIKLQFSEHRYPYIIAKPIHGSMKIIDKNNRIVSVDVIPNKELESLILSFGNDVEILEPKRLRNKIGKILKSISNKYN